MKNLANKIIERIGYTGNTSPGAYNLAADLMELASTEVYLAEGTFYAPKLLNRTAIHLRRKASETSFIKKEKSDGESKG